MRNPIRKFLSWLFHDRQLALISSFALLFSAAFLGISSRSVQAADTVTNVVGVEGNASVALSWTAPNSNLPLTFGVTGDASTALGNLGGGNNSGNNDCPADYAITGIGTGTSNNIVQARCTKIDSDGTLNAALTSTLTWFGGGASRWSYCSTGKVAVSIRGGSNWLQSMSLKCATPPAVSDTVELAAWPAASTGTTVDSACPTGQIVKGFYGRSGAWIDAVRSRCATFGTAAFTDFAIQYSSNNGSTWTTFAHTASSATSRTVTGLTNGTSYVFRVAHVSAGVTGSYSDPSAAYIPFTTPPAPTGLSGTRGNTEVALSWTAPASNNGREITDYVVQYSNNSGTSWTTFTDGVSTTTSSTVTGLTNGTSYVFRVAAVNLAGTGTYTSNSSALVPATVPNTPTALTATYGNASIALAWTAPSTGGTALTDYVIQYSTDNSTWTTFVDSVSTTASVTVTGLTNYSTYYFRVAAINAVGTGTYSSPSVTSVPGVLPGAPTLSTPTPGNSQVALSWTASAATASSITDWIVQYSTNNSTWTTFSDGVSTTTSAIVTGLTNGTFYYFRVAGVNPATTGTYSVSASSTPRTVPDAPIITSLTPGNTQIMVAWSAPATGGSSITDYDLEYSSNSGSTWTAWASGTTSTATSATVTGLTNGTAYVFRVLAKNVAGSGANSSTSTSATPRTLPGATGQPVLTVGDRRIVVSWTAPTNNGGSAVTDYRVLRAPDAAGLWQWGVITDGISSATSFTDTTTSNGVDYYYIIAAINAAGTGPDSVQSLVGRPLGVTVAPTNVVGTAGDAQVSLTWTAPAANGGTISDYTIQYSSDSGATWTTFSDTVS
ncbi:MAG: fibronectin type III domain-containing protein, partial [Actinobacteria bacterium]|nr:fibronectin type III domain-containing protein [Actinomycetota bacterium]